MRMQFGNTITIRQGKFEQAKLLGSIMVTNRQQTLLMQQGRFNNAKCLIVEALEE
jgi:hypothetical protein